MAKKQDPKREFERNIKQDFKALIRGSEEADNFNKQFNDKYGTVKNNVRAYLTMKQRSQIFENKVFSLVGQDVQIFDLNKCDKLD